MKTPTPRRHARLHLGRAVFHLLAVLALFCPKLSAQVPGILSYQGRITVNNAPFSGTGQFKFALVNAAGTTTLWSHDNTSAGGGQPAGSVSLVVTGGLYSVLLGDTSVPGMTQAIPASVFAQNSDVRVRVWFNDGANGFQLLSPDQRVAAVGYAMNAPGGIPLGIATFTTVGNTNFTVPEGVFRIQAEVWGGGGGAAGNTDVGATGGGGGYSRKFLDVTPGQVLTVYVGAGGNGAYAADTSSSAVATAGATSGIRNAQNVILVESGGGGGASFNGSANRTGGAGGAVDGTAQVTREGEGGGVGNSSSGSIVAGGSTAQGTVTSPLGQNVFAGPGMPPGGNSVDMRRPHGTGGMYRGQFFGGGYAQHGFPGFVAITW